MKNLTASDILSIISTLAAILFAYLAFRRGQKQDDSASASTLATMQGDIKYIRSRVDDVNDATTAHGTQIHAIEIKQATLESSVKSANKRIDALEQKVS